MNGADVASASAALAELRAYLTSAKFSAPGELAHYVNVADVLARMRPAELALITDTCACGLSRADQPGAHTLVICHAGTPADNTCMPTSAGSINRS